MKQKLSWDNLQLVLAIADGQGLSGAAKRLGVHHATVLRRLDAFEYAMGVVLFDRQPSGYVPTDIGEALADRARLIATDVEQTFRMLAGADLRLSGTVRLATADFLAQTLVAEAAKRFKQAHPAVELEVVVSIYLASLSKRDADAALRVLPTNMSSGPLVGRVLAPIRYGVFAAPDQQIDLMHLPWVTDEQTASHSTTNLWQQKFFRGVPTAIRVNNLMSKFSAIKSGLGIGFLPLYLGKAESSLTLLKTHQEWALNLWFLAHTDLYRLPRIQALQDAIAVTAQRICAPETSTF